MLKRSWLGGVIPVAVFGVIGIGLTVAAPHSPAPTTTTLTPNNLTASAGPTSSGGQTGSGGSGGSTRSGGSNGSTGSTGSGRTPVTGTSSSDIKCSAVYKATAPSGDSVGKLCTTVVGSATAIRSVTVTFTTTSKSTCSDTVTLRTSGVDQDGEEFAKVSTVDCDSDTATASFQPVTQTISGSYICGELIAPDTYIATQACVSIT